jgi:hypothetical protein
MRKVLAITVFSILMSSSFAKRRVLSKEESDYLNNLNVIKVNKLKSIKSEQVANITGKNKKVKIKKNNPYKPAPVVPKGIKKDGFFIDRDSKKVRKIRVTTNDSFNVTFCPSSGVTIGLDKNYPGNFQNVILDGLQNDFSAQLFLNQRSVYVKLLSSPGRGEHISSPMRLILRDTDETLFVNLVGVPCPKRGLNPFPAVYYISPKTAFISENDGTLPPRDKIYKESFGYKIVKKNSVLVYDMVGSAGSNWVVFGVEVQFPVQENRKKVDIAIKVLDNLQLSRIPTKQTYLVDSTLGRTEELGTPTIVYKVAMQIDKEYLLTSRYIHLMILDKTKKEYQYMQVDLLPYYNSLKKRGIDL